MNLTRTYVESRVGLWTVEGDAHGVWRVYSPLDIMSVNSGPLAGTVCAAARQLEQYFAGRRRHFDVDLHLAGTEFQNEVWLALINIPYGEVRSYGEVAATVGRPGAFRAVGNANRKNPWPVMVPCHRVVAAHDIGGYAGGDERGLRIKRFLLELEGNTDYC